MLVLILSNAYKQTRFRGKQIVSRGLRLLITDGKPGLCIAYSTPSSQQNQKLCTSFAFAVGNPSLSQWIIPLRSLKLVLSVVSITMALHAPVSYVL